MYYNMKITFYVFLSLKYYIDIVIDYMHNICYIHIALKIDSVCNVCWKVTYEFKKKPFFKLFILSLIYKICTLFSDLRTLCYASKVVRFEIDQSSRKVDKSLLKTIVGIVGNFANI